MLHNKSLEMSALSLAFKNIVACNEACRYRRVASQLRRWALILLNLD